MKNLIISCCAAVALVAMVGCSCDSDRHTTSESASMSTDSKDMHPRHHMDQ